MMRKARHVVELWQSLGLGRMPTRDRLKLCNFPMLEPNVFQTNVAARLEDYRITVAGKVVERSYGAKLNGVSFGELDLGTRKDEMLSEYELCVSGRVAIASRHLMHMPNGVTELHRVLLPFDSPLKSEVGQVIGWCHLAPMPRTGAKGAVTRFTTEERVLIAPGV